MTREQIVFPIRSILRNYDNVDFVFGEVAELDHQRNTILLRNCDVMGYDYLVIARGTVVFSISGRTLYDH